MSRIQGVIFDLFHTLVDVGVAPGASGRYTADILGIDREQWNRACFGANHEICRPTRHDEVVRNIARSLRPEIDDALIAEATAERQRRFDHALCNVDPKVMEALQALRAEGYRLGLLSNASSGEVSAWPSSPLAPLFDAALFSCDCGTCKPEADFYRQALESLDLHPHEVVFVGDGNSDEHRGAAEVGLHTVLTTYFTASKLDEEALERRGKHARWRIGALSELPACIARIEQSRR